MVKTTVREALRDAMAEEMRADDRVFVMGEEVAQYQGAYKVTQGLLDEFGERPRHRYADHRIWLRRRRHGCGDGGSAPDRRVHDLQLRDAGDRPHHQLGRQDQLHVGRPDALPGRVPRAQRCGGARRRAAFAELCALVCLGSGPDRDRALFSAPTPRACSRRRSAARIRSCSSRTSCSTARAFEVPDLDDFVLPIGKARVAKRGQGRHAGQLLDRRRRLARGV